MQLPSEIEASLRYLASEEARLSLAADQSSLWLGQAW